MTAGQRRDDRPDSFHAGRRLRTLGGENPLHVQAKVDTSLVRGKREQCIAHGQPLTIFPSEPSPHRPGKHRNREPCYGRKDESPSRRPFDQQPDNDSESRKAQASECGPRGISMRHTVQL